MTEKYGYSIFAIPPDWSRQDREKRLEAINAKLAEALDTLTKSAIAFHDDMEDMADLPEASMATQPLLYALRFARIALAEYEKLHHGGE